MYWHELSVTNTFLDVIVPSGKKLYIVFSKGLLTSLYSGIFTSTFSIFSIFLVED